MAASLQTTFVKATSGRVAVRPAKVAVQASLRTEVAKVAKAAGVSVASLALALSAHADVTIKMGADNGALVFEPASVTIKAGDKVTFVNNAGFPHNVVFDGDAVPGGDAVAEALSHDDYFNAPGETFTIEPKAAGSYSYYCEPHQGAGMAGTITVQ